MKDALILQCHLLLVQKLAQLVGVRTNACVLMNSIHVQERIIPEKARISGVDGEHKTELYAGISKVRVVIVSGTILLRSLSQFDISPKILGILFRKTQTRHGI